MNEASIYKREANRLIHEGLRARDPAEPIAFFCECDDPHCYQVAWLTGAEFESRRRDLDVRALATKHSRDDRVARSRDRLARSAA